MVWRDLRLNPGFQDHWRTFYPLGQWAVMKVDSLREYQIHYPQVVFCSTSPVIVNPWWGTLMRIYLDKSGTRPPVWIGYLSFRWFSLRKSNFMTDVFLAVRSLKELEYKKKERKKKKEKEILNAEFKDEKRKKERNKYSVITKFNAKERKVSLFNGLSTFVSYLTLKPSL